MVFNLEKEIFPFAISETVYKMGIDMCLFLYYTNK